MRRSAMCAISALFCGVSPATGEPAFQARFSAWLSANRRRASRVDMVDRSAWPLRNASIPASTTRGGKRTRTFGISEPRDRGRTLAHMPKALDRKRVSKKKDPTAVQTEPEKPKKFDAKIVQGELVITGRA